MTSNTFLPSSTPSLSPSPSSSSSTTQATQTQQVEQSHTTQATQATQTLQAQSSQSTQTTTEIPSQTLSTSLSSSSSSPSTKYSIRLATSNDAEAILSLIQALADYERESKEVTNTAEQLRQDGWGASPKFIAWVAEWNLEDTKKVVGFALCFYNYSTWKGVCLYLEDLFVLPEYRSFGVGKSLISTCIHHAHDNNCQRVMWSALDWNVNALNFYAKLGAIETREWVTIRMTRDKIEAFVQAAKNTTTDITSNLDN
jgi:GNAT superfamily N-acetyltransferase